MREVPIDGATAYKQKSAPMRIISYDIKHEYLHKLIIINDVNDASKQSKLNPKLI